MSDEDDPALISRFRSGDESALCELIAELKEPLFRFIIRYVCDSGDAEDLLSQSFVKAWHSRDRYQPRAKFKTWLYTIAGNLCRDHARKKKRHPADFAAGSTVFDEAFHSSANASAPNSPSTDAVRHEESALLHQAIDELNDDLKRALILFSLEGHTQEETAALLGCTPKAVESRVYRAKQQLRSKLRQIEN